MKNYVQPGNIITLTAPYAVASGDGLLVGAIFGVASGTAALGEAVETAVEGRGKVTAPIFLLVPQVKLPKRLDLARDADRALDSVPGLIVANWVEAKI